ncbi:MAG: right-handed parallel beta-helix repeat-containing protein, partial [Fidelibacterota bacterium]
MKTSKLNKKGNRFMFLMNTIFIAVLILPISNLYAQSCGDILTADITLTADLDCSTGGTALKVGAHNIIIDGGGFSITIGGNNTGIELYNYSGVTIKNVTVVSTNAGQGYGIRLSNSSNSFVQNNTLSGLLHGLYVSGSSYDTVIDGND